MKRIRVYFRKDAFLRPNEKFQEGKEDVFLTPAHFVQLMRYRKFWERGPDIRIYLDENDDPTNFIAHLVAIADSKNRLGWFQEVRLKEYVRATYDEVTKYLIRMYSLYGLNYAAELLAEQSQLRQNLPTPDNPKTGNIRSNAVMRETYYMEEHGRPPALSVGEDEPVGGFIPKPVARRTLRNRKSCKTRKNLKRKRTRSTK